MLKHHRTLLLKVDPARPEPTVIEQVVSVLLSGGLVAFPTETVYGLAAVADNPDAIASVFRAKERPHDQPLSVQVAPQAAAREVRGAKSEVRTFALRTSSFALPLELEAAILTVAREIPDRASRLIRRFMPGPLTLVLLASDHLSTLTTAGTGKVGVRIPLAPVAVSILSTVGKPLVVTSANRHGRPATISAGDVLEQLDGRIDLLLDGGSCSLGMESTVVDVTVDPPVILRVGAIAAAEIAQAIGVPSPLNGQG
jgi:L-threonylcarbamoyladenylate synthase